MKHLAMAVTVLLLGSLACSVGLKPTDVPTVTAEAPTPTAQPATPTPSPTPTSAPVAPKPALQSEVICGDRFCDQSETAVDCPQDCQPEDVSEDSGAVAPTAETAQEPSAEPSREDERVVLYHVVQQAVTSHSMNDKTCFMFSFVRFLDAGAVNSDGSDNQVLALKDHPTSKVTAKVQDDFFYISSPHDPVAMTYGISMFNWDVEDQTLWSAGFVDNQPTKVAASREAEFPGALATAPGNKHLVFLMTQRTAGESSQSAGLVPSKFNPYVSDSSLFVGRPSGAGTEPVLSGNTNRQLFTSFSDFSPDARFFYTIVREGDGFGFIRVDLESESVEGFSKVLPGFDWSRVPWDELFPRTEDFSYAYFAIAPDETRLIAYKNYFQASLDNPCNSEASHDLWVFDLEEDGLERIQGRPGYVADAEWKPDSTQFALAVVANSGCYPDYLDAKIDVLNREGQEIATLVQELKSKITTLGWSPDGGSIAYDTYTTDFVGRLKLIDLTDGNVSEILNTQSLGQAFDPAAPITLLFADWVSPRQ